MKTTNAEIMVKVNTDAERIGLVFSFNLHREDLEIVEQVIKPELDRTTATEHDLADVLLTCLTYGIHKAYEDAEGVPFTLRMDRKKNRS